MRLSHWHLALALSVLTLAGSVLARNLGFSLEISSLRTGLLFLVLAPVLEEYVFRAQLQQWLADQWQRPRWAWLVATALFAMAHAPWMGWPALWLIVPGLALGWVWLTYRSLLLNVIVHASFNGVLVLATLWI